jgi:hypothetical protein
MYTWPTLNWLVSTHKRGRERDRQRERVNAGVLVALMAVLVVGIS